jgi:adenine phosphoribosyltransferase
MTEDLAARLRARLRRVPDFPTPGVLFRDIAPILADAELFGAAVDALAQPFAGAPPAWVAGVESRGFLLGAPMALRLGAGFLPLRKLGKLPGPTARQTYALEYGTGELEAQTGLVRPGDRVLLVDDVLATGGTAEAAAALVRALGGEPMALAVLLELAELGGRARVPVPVHALLAD